MEYEKYIAPIVVALALSTGCKYGCGKDDNNYRPNNTVRQNDSDERQPCRRRGRNRTIENSVKPEHVLAPKSRNYTSPQGVRYIIIVQPNYGRPIRITPSGRRIEGGNYPPKPSSSGCIEPREGNPGSLSAPRGPNLDDVVDDVEDAMVREHGRGK